jgi:ubiquinone/menaquinone biosynthesis C-methylase UbiE
MASHVLPIHQVDNGYSQQLLRDSTLVEVHRYALKIEYFLDIKPNEVVLDFGCGDGQVTELLAKKYPMTHFIGVDYSSSLIDVAKKRNECGNLTYIVANISQAPIPIPDGSVDKIFSWGVVYYLNPKEEYSVYQSEFLRISKVLGLICHFQIPLRKNLNLRIFFFPESLRIKITRLARFFREVFSAKYGLYSYRYSVWDILKGKANYSEVKIIPDDVFLDRISVIYTKKDKTK